ncbi:MAG TPA: hypothetical protein VF216_03050 [Mizugakiibacter sp.]
MHAPQIIYLSLLLLDLGIHLVRDGQRREKPYDFGGELISVCLVVGLLYWGGFFG